MNMNADGDGDDTDRATAMTTTTTVTAAATATTKRKNNDDDDNGSARTDATGSRQRRLLVGGDVGTPGGASTGDRTVSSSNIELDDDNGGGGSGGGSGGENKEGKTAAAKTARTTANPVDRSLSSGIDTTTFLGDLVNQKDLGLIHQILSFVPPKDLAKYRLVSLKFNNLCQDVIKHQPKKAFETNQELRDGVLSYCSGYRSENNKVYCIYGRVINKWNVSKITDFSCIFVNMGNNTGNFNEPIEDWDTSNATSMRAMFDGARSFNQPLDKWDTSKVTEMFLMFYGATSFNQPLGKWDVSNVTDMGRMFGGATSFNQPLEKWDVSNVTNMGGMFDGARSFNQPLNKWDVTDMAALFRHVPLLAFDNVDDDDTFGLSHVSFRRMRRTDV